MMDGRMRRWLGAALLFAAFTVAAPAQQQPSAAEIKAERDLAMLMRRVTQEYEAGEYETALSRLDALQGAAAQDLAARNLRGAIYTKLKRYEEARATFGDILKADPAYFPAIYNMGEVLFVEGRFEEALDYFRRMSRRDPRNELVRFKLVLCYLLLDRVDDARKVAETFIAAGSTPAYYYAQAMLAEKAGDTRARRENLAAARSIYGDKRVKLFEDSIGEVKF